MINLRYHIVSITAVFLALGIGVALGSTLIQRGLVDNLNDRLDDQAERLDRTDGENAELRSELEEIDALERQLTVEGMSLYAGHLTDVPVVLVTSQGEDEGLVELTRASLRGAGADVVGQLRFTMRWQELDADEVAELAELTGRPLTNASGARTRTMRDLAQEMLTASEPEPEPEPEISGDATTTGAEGEEPATSEPGDGPTTDAPVVPAIDGEAPTGEDPAVGSTTTTTVPEPNGLLLDALVERGYVEFLPDSSAVPLPAHGARFVVLHGPEADLSPDGALLPLLRALAAGDPAPVVLAETLPEPSDDEEEAPDELAAGTLVTEVRTDPQLALSITTTDVARRFIGQAAIVLGLAELDPASPVVGHYGLAAGATSLLPTSAG